MRVKVIVISFLAGVLGLPIENNSSTTVRELKYQTFPQQHSTENVRHVIAKQEPVEEVSRAVKKEKAIVTIEEERFPTLEELRVKCQHFSRLFGLSGQYVGSTADYSNNEDVERHSSTTTATDYYNKPVIEVTRRPVYIRNRPTFIQKTNGGFYVTASPTQESETTSRKTLLWTSSTYYPKVSHTSPSTTTPTTTTTVTTTQPTTTKSENTTTPTPKIKVKYTKYEPVILQKTILTDGRVMYHWHRSLPTGSLDLPEFPAPILSPTALEYTPLAQRNDDGLIEHSTPSTTTTTTTTERSSWLFVPFSSLFGGSHEEDSTSTEPTTTTPWPPSTEASSTKAPLSTSTTEEPKPAQLKLVVPIHYDDIDQMAASQNRQSDSPPPNLQVIKTVGIPQTVPRYSLGYTGTGYGLTYNNAIPYGAGIYGPDYLNYQAYNNPLYRRSIGET